MPNKLLALRGKLIVRNNGTKLVLAPQPLKRNQIF